MDGEVALSVTVIVEMAVAALFAKKICEAAEEIVGGGTVGVTEFEALEAELVPIALVAVTVKV